MTLDGIELLRKREVLQGKRSMLLYSVDDHVSGDKNVQLMVGV